MPDEPVLEHPVDSKDDEPGDALVEELLSPLSPEMARELYSTSETEYTQAIQDRTVWEDNLDVWENQYYGRLPEKNFPWPGASNLHVPITMLGIETLRPRLVESILGEHPPIIVSPTTVADEERRDRVELFLNWQVESEMRIEPLVEASAYAYLNPGLVIAKIFWKVSRRRRRSVRTFEPTTSIPALLTAVFPESSPEWVTSGPNEIRGTAPGRPGTGGPLEFRLKFEYTESVLRVLVECEELTEHPEIELIDQMNVVVPSHAGADVQKLPWICHRAEMTEQDLRRMVQRGIFSEEAVTKLLARGAEDQATPELGSGQGLAATRDEVEGVTGTQSTPESFDVREVCRSWDIDDDGYEEEILYWWSPDLKGEILGWDYLDNVYAHGRRPYVIGRFMAVPFRFYPIGFAEMVRNLQEEINTIHNQRVDAGTLTNDPWFGYRASSSFAPGAIRLAPGVGIPLDNPGQDLYLPRFAFSPAFGQGEEALNYQYYERLSGITDMTLGRQPNRVGATRTATGVASLLSESGLRFKSIMRGFQRFWVEIFEHVLALDQQYLPSGKEFRVTGRLPEKIRIHDRTAIAGRFDLRISATTETLSRGTLREGATIVFQSLMNPGLVQAGIVGVRGIRQATMDFLKAYGKDPAVFVEPLPADQFPHTPEEELQLLTRGETVKPSPLENAAYHLQVHTLQLQNPVLRAFPEIAGVLSRHMAETARLLQSQQLAASMGQRSGTAVGPQAMNAQTGRFAPAAGPPPGRGGAPPAEPQPQGGGAPSLGGMNG